MLKKLTEHMNDVYRKSLKKTDIGATYSPFYD